MMDSNENALSQDSLLEHAVWLRRLARELVRDPGAADDLVQDTWLAALRSKPDGSQSLRPWLGRVMRNGATQRLRRAAGRLARESAAAQPESMPSAGELVERAEEQRHLVDAVLALPEPYRQTLLLRFYEGLTPSQIAASLQLPAATIRTRLHRGLIQLRESLDRKHGGDRKAWVLMLQPMVGEAAVPVSIGILVALAATVLAVAGTWFGYRAGIWSAQPIEPVPGVDGSPVRAPAFLVQAEGADPTRSNPPSDLPVEPGERSLRLLDARTGRDLADFWVRVEGVEHRSSPGGTIVVPDTATELIPLDDKRQALSVGGRHQVRIEQEVRRGGLDLAGALESGTLAISIGPLYEIQVTAPVRLSPGDLRASLETEPAENGREVRFLAPLLGGEAGGPPTYVRFAPLPQSYAESHSGWKLVVRDASGHWMGQAALANGLQDAGSILKVEMQSTAKVQGWIEGLASMESVQIIVRPKNVESPVVWAQPRADGSFLVSHLLPGDYCLEVSAPLCADWKTNFTLQPGAEFTQRVRLEPAATAGGLSGIVRSQSGEYAGQLLVFLRDTRGALVGVYPTTWKLDVERGGLAPFAFDAVPSGGLSVDVVSLQDEVGFSLNPSALVAPNSEVDILLLDQEPACDWNFRIVNAIEDTVLENVNLRVVFEDGRQRRYMGEWKHAPEPGASAYTWTRIAGEMRWNEFEGPAVLQGLSERARFTWTVRAEGFAPATGDQDALDDDGKGGRSMVVRLKPIDPSNEKNK